MAEDKEIIELRPDSKKSDKKSDKKPTEKNTKQSSPNFKKKTLLIPVLAVLAVLFLGVGAFLTYSFVNNNEDVPPELTYAEDLEQYQLQEGASQNDHNSSNLRLAWAYYEEESYNRALELLKLIQEPEEAIVASYNELHGLVLVRLDKNDEAQEYNQTTLEVHEEYLLASAKENPIAYYDLGRLYANAGYSDKAIENYQKYIDAYNNPPEEGYEPLDEEIVGLAEQAIEELR